MTEAQTIVLVVAAGLAVAAGVALGVAVARRPSRPAREVAALLEAQAGRIDRLADALGRQSVDDQAIREGLTRLRGALDEVRVRAEARQRVEERGWDAIRRLESVLLGASSRGRAGENVLREALDALPPGMVVRDFRVNGKVVELALVLPDGRRLPVDSKWAALAEVEALEDEEDPRVRETLARRVEDEVARRAREVASYLEATLTTPFGVACVPDAAYALCRRAHADAFARGVVVVPYSSALPVLLALYALGARFGDPGDARSSLTELEGLLEAMEATLENKVARAATMLQNAADEWRTHLGRARGAVARGRAAGALPGRAGESASDPDEVPADPPEAEEDEGEGRPLAVAR